MTATSAVRSIFRSAIAGIGLAMGAYAAYVAVTWSRYGCATAASDDDADPLLDEFMPKYEVAERHHVRVAAPAENIAIARMAIKRRTLWPRSPRSERHDNSWSDA